MEGYILEWLNLLGRWVHLVTGIAWIGASFYFVWLDNSLETPKRDADVERGVGGEIWSVHGGGFYHAQKYTVAPPKLPETLHWFKWEAYTTWLSGMFMLILMYWYSAEIYLIDPGVAQLSKPVAIAIGFLVLLFGWIGYDALCRSRIGSNEKLMAAILFVAISIIAFLLCQVFSGRGAYIHFGAMLGTIMVGNVFFVIIPGQKDLVAACAAGRKPDPVHGIRGKQRSVHNTYFTLPVLFAMMSNHYAMTYAHPLNWLVLIAISLAGALIRVYFVSRHRGKASPIPLLASVVVLAGVAAMMVPAPRAGTDEIATSTATAVSNQDPQQLFAMVQGIVEQRCAGCHAQQPSQPGFLTAPQGILLETEAEIRQHAQAIYQQTVVLKAMPIGNLTRITDAERSTLAAWFEMGDSQ